MTHRAILLLAVLAAAGSACSPRSPAAPPGGSVEPPSLSSEGSESSLPTPEEYAQRLDDPSRDAWQRPEEVVSLLECPPGGRVVDLGAGTGYFLDLLSQAVGPEGRVLALDTEPSMVDWMHERIVREQLRNVQPDTIAPDDPGLTPGSVDRVLIVNTWHHIEDRVRYGEKLREGLRPSGQVLIVDFTMESPIGPPAAMRLTIDTVRSELESAGFVTRVLEETLPHQYAVQGSTR